MTRPFRIAAYFLTVCALCLFVTHCAHAADFDRTDKLLFGSFVTLQAIDALQTNEIRKHPDQFREANPLYGNPPNMALVIGVKAALVTGVYYLTRDATSAQRKTALALINVISIGIVANNLSVGVRIGF